MKDVKINCDQCGLDLTYTRNSVDYRLSLEVERLPIDPEVSTVTEMLIHPPMKQDAHFCGVFCLAQWVAVKFPDARERRGEKRA